MWFISLLQLGCTLAQSCQTLLRTAELVAFKHVVYFLFTKATLPVQKWHLLLLCREELLHSADVFVFLSRLTWAAYVLEKKTKFLSSNLSVKKRQRKALAFVLCHCSVFTSCLHVTQSRRGMRVHFFCCSLGFFNLSSVFLAHTFFSQLTEKQKETSDSVWWDPPNLLQPAHTLLEKVAHLTAFMQFVGESDACISMNCT